MYQQNDGHENEYTNLHDYANYELRPSKDSFAYLAAADIESTYQINEDEGSESR